MKEREGETNICHPSFEAPSDENIFRFCKSNFFTDDGCEHAKMKQFTFVAGNIRSQYTLFWKSRWILTQNYNQDLLQYWIGASVLKR